MKTYAVTIPEMAIVAATRGVAGAGIGLLVAGLLRPDTRRTLGWTLLPIGALSTIPIAMASSLASAFRVSLISTPSTELLATPDAIRSRAATLSRLRARNEPR